ncbi:LCP family protein [Planomicrobium sp. CPCC 101110]|uniref:LCP family glycopolymer transferase n=1 Tax=Planomicrobium sp. CPCC 101110 TaxID=2599619 RepID=UPI00351BA94C
MLCEITVNNELDWYDEGYYKKNSHNKQGKIALDGSKSMGYVRMHHLDPDGDFGRTKRQRQIIEAILTKSASVKSVSKTNEMLAVLGASMSTNTDFNDMKNLLINHADVRKNVTSYRIKGDGNMLNSIYYLIISKEEISKVHEMISDIKF